MTGGGAGAHDYVKSLQQLPTVAAEATYSTSCRRQPHLTQPLATHSRLRNRRLTAPLYFSVLLLPPSLVSSFIFLVTCLPIPFPFLMCLLIKSRLHICQLIPPTLFLHLYQISSLFHFFCVLYVIPLSYSLSYLPFWLSFPLSFITPLPSFFLYMRRHLILFSGILLHSIP